MGEENLPKLRPEAERARDEAVYMLLREPAMKAFLRKIAERFPDQDDPRTLMVKMMEHIESSLKVVY